MFRNKTPTSCTVILNGHGSYCKNSVIIDTSKTEHSIIFTCTMRNTVNNLSHNLLLSSFAKDSEFAWNFLESTKSTRFANKNAPRELTTDMSAKHTHLVYEHAMMNAENVIDVDSLKDIDSNRFVECDAIIDDNMKPLNGKGKLVIEYDENQVVEDVRTAYANNPIQNDSSIHLSAKNILQLRFTAPNGGIYSAMLSELIEEIIPKIKIPAIGHENNKFEIMPFIYVGDNKASTKEFLSSDFSDKYNAEKDIYFELTIAGDANIIFDMCREEV